MFYVNYLLVCFRDYDPFGCSFTSVLVLFATDVTCLEYHPWFQRKEKWNKLLYALWFWEITEIPTNFWLSVIQIKTYEADIDDSWQN